MAAEPEGASSGDRGSTRSADRLLPLPRSGEPAATPRVSRGGSSEPQAVKMAADPDGVSSGVRGITRHADRLHSLPRAGEPTATSRMSRGGSSSLRSQTSGGAACHTADTDGMGNQMVRAADAVGGRGEHYLGHSSPSYGSRAASSGGRGDASSFVAPRKEEIQGRLFSGGDFIDTKTPEDLVPSVVSTVNNAGGDCTDVKKHPPISLKIRPSGRPPCTGFCFDQFASKENPAGNADTGNKDANDNRFFKRDGQGPHPPPFYKCQVCQQRTAFSIVECCHLIICKSCGCNCSAEGKKVHTKDLPKVKLEGSDLFHWKAFPFPASALFLFKAKRMGKYLQYFFAPVEELFNTRTALVTTSIYTFQQKGMEDTSIEISQEVVPRNAVVH